MCDEPELVHGTSAAIPAAAAGVSDSLAPSSPAAASSAQLHVSALMDVAEPTVAALPADEAGETMAAGNDFVDVGAAAARNIASPLTTPRSELVVQAAQPSVRRRAARSAVCGGAASDISDAEAMTVAGESSPAKHSPRARNAAKRSCKRRRGMRACITCAVVALVMLLAAAIWRSLRASPAAHVLPPLLHEADNVDRPPSWDTGQPDQAHLEELLPLSKTTYDSLHLSSLAWEGRMRGAHVTNAVRVFQTEVLASAEEVAAAQRSLGTRDTLLWASLQDMHALLLRYGHGVRLHRYLCACYLANA